MPELSIIVPVYKVEKYLPKCIDSILAQTFRDFELLLIDDGSPDNCGAICDDYAARDSRIKVIHQKNAGVSAARNAGLDIAAGTYLGFVDSDDWIEPQMYETMIRTAKDKNVDVVACGVQEYDENGNWIHSGLLTEAYFDNSELCLSVFAMPNPLGGCIWNKIVNREKIRTVRYRYGVSMAEDRLFLCEYYKFCNSCYKIPDAFYAVRTHSESATHQKNVSVPYEMVTSSYLLLNIARKNSKELESAAADKFLDDCTRYIPHMILLGNKTNQPFRRRMMHCYSLAVKTIIRCYRYDILSRNKLHGYIYELAKIMLKQ